jgi:hypothetical protein
MDTHSYSNIPASCLGTGNDRHHEASAEDLRRYAQALSLSLDDLCGNKSELPVGSVWNLDAVEATLTKARAKGRTFDKDCYASPWPRK